MENAFSASYHQVPTQYKVLGAMYRVMAAEWMVTNTYSTRELNNVDWRLQDGRGNGLKTAKEFEENLITLFSLRRRVSRYLALISLQRSSCESQGMNLWKQEAPGASGEEPTTKAVQLDDPLLDFQQIEKMTSQSLERINNNIQHITSLEFGFQGRLALDEAKNTAEQNRMVLLLAVVATFFLPISTMSTVLGMNGEWSPGNPKFGVFWAITISISVILMSGLLLLRSNLSFSTIAARLDIQKKRDRDPEILV